MAVRPGERRGGRAFCRTCAHPEHVRIDFLLASGPTCKSISTKFRLHHDSVLRHRARHLSREFVASIKLGPFKSEAELRRLTAENSNSVLENLMALYGALTSRFLACHESGSDQLRVLLSKELHRNLELRAKISRELAPPSTTVTTNVFNLAPVLELQGALLRVLARPEFAAARAEVIKAFREIEAKQPPMIEIPATEAAA